MKKVFIIAEAGINHNGKISLAKKLIFISKKAGADAVKFQLFDTDNFINKNHLPKVYKRMKSLEFTINLNTISDVISLIFKFNLFKNTLTKPLSVFIE